MQAAALVGGGQQFAGLVAPGRALRGGHSGHGGGQLGGGFLQGRGQHLALGALPHTIEQGAGREGVARHVARKVVGRRLKHLQLAGPVAGGFKARRKALRKLQRPVALGPGHELGVGHQHHCARQMGAMGLGMCGNLGQSTLPQGGAGDSKPTGLIAFRYDCHSVARPGHTGERGIGFCHNAQTLNVHRSQPAQNQGIRHGQRTHQTCL